MMRFITNPKWWISPNIKYNFYSRYFLFVAFHFLFTKTFRSRPVWCAQSDRSLLARNQNQFGIRRGPEGEKQAKKLYHKNLFCNWLNLWTISSHINTLLHVDFIRTDEHLKHHSIPVLRSFLCRTVCPRWSPRPNPFWWFCRPTACRWCTWERSPRLLSKKWSTIYNPKVLLKLTL